jgi:hypothetical protein
MIINLDSIDLMLFSLVFQCHLTKGNNKITELRTILQRESQKG